MKDEDRVLVTFARAVCDAQILEERLRSIVGRKSLAEIAFSGKSMAEAFKPVYKWTMGKMALQELPRNIPIHTTVEDFLKGVVNSRNYLCHHFFLTESKRLLKSEEIPKLIEEIKGHGSKFVLASKLLDVIAPSEKGILDNLTMPSSQSASAPE